MAAATYLIGLGSNRRGRHGGPEAEIRAALAEIGVAHASRIIISAPLGPSIRRFANAVAIVESKESPPELLARLKQIERDFGRRGGRRWGARVIDLDVILWSNGAWADDMLTVPHPHFRTRAFVLTPALEIAPNWRDPLTRQTLRQLSARLTKRQAIPRRNSGDGLGP